MGSQLHIQGVEKRLRRALVIVLPVIPFARLAHVAKHLPHQHRLEFLCDAAKPIAVRGARGGGGGSAGLGVGIYPRLGDEGVEIEAHRITSSARSAPAALRACMMAITSRGDVPSVFSARTTSASVVPESRLMTCPRLSSTSTSVRGTTVVWPPLSGAGCETSRRVVIFTDRLP